MAVQIDLTTLSGYESLPAGTYALAVRAKASGYTDSDLSSTVSFTKLAAPVVTAADTTVTWDAVTNAASYDVYVDGELYENTTGGYDITVNVTNGTYTGDTSISNTATITITADSGYNLPDAVTVTGASQTWNKETGTLTLTNPTGAVTVSAVCVAVSYTLEAGTYKWVDSPVMPSVSFDISNISAKYYYLTANNTYSNTADPSNYFVINSNSISIGDVDEGIYTNYYVGDGWYTRNQNDDASYTATDTNKLRTIIVNADFEVTADFYNWAITGGNLVKQP